MLLALWAFALGFCFGLLVEVGKTRRHRKHHRRVYINLLVDGTRSYDMDMKVNDQRSYSLQASDEFGNIVPLPVFDSPPAWAVSDPSLLSIQPSDDGLSALVLSPSGKLGAVQVSLSGSEGGQQIVGSDSFNMIPGDVASIKLVAGPDVPAPAAPAPVG